MEAITLADVVSFISATAGVITGGGVIYHFIHKNTEKNIRTVLEPTNEKIDQLSNKVSDVALANCKNYIVSFLAKLECDGVTCRKPTDEETQRFWECYDEYVDLGGNSYIHEKVEKLKREGKL